MEVSSLQLCFGTRTTSQEPAAQSFSGGKSKMRNASVVMALMALCVSTSAFAGRNPNITLPLHAKASSFEPCNGYLPVDCTGEKGSPTRPTVNIPAAAPTAVFLLANNHTDLAGVQTAF